MRSRFSPRTNQHLQSAPDEGRTTAHGKVSAHRSTRCLIIIRRIPAWTADCALSYQRFGPDDDAAICLADRLIGRERELEEELAHASGVKSSKVSDIPELAARGIANPMGNESTAGVAFARVLRPCRLDIGGVRVGGAAER